MSIFCSIDLARKVKKSCLAANTTSTVSSKSENKTNENIFKENFFFSSKKVFSTFQNLEENANPIVKKQDFLHFLL